MDEQQKTTLLDSGNTVVPDESKTELFDRTKISDSHEIPTNPPEPVEAKKSKKGLFIFILLVIIALGAAAYFFLFKKNGNITAESPEIRQMQQLSQELSSKESEVKDIQQDIQKNVEEINKQSTGAQPLDLNLKKMNLSGEEKKLVEQRISDEKDSSVKSLLQDILKKDKEIQDLKDKISEIEKKLPVPHVVKKGESHYQIAMDFLVKEKGVDKAKAKELVERTALLDTVVPGFKIYNFYADEEYGTSVTQGTAAISPNSLIKREKKVLIDAKDEAISQRDALAQDIKTLEAKRDEIIAKLETLNGQLDELTKEKESLVSQVGELNQQVNSLFYLADTEKNLKDKQILKGGFLRSTKLKDFSAENFKMSIDLRSNSTINISASELGIDKIKSITIYPNFYKAGVDYKLEIAGDKSSATFTILQPGKFKNERLLLSVN